MTVHHASREPNRDGGTVFETECARADAASARLDLTRHPEVRRGWRVIPWPRLVHIPRRGAATGKSHVWLLPVALLLLYALLGGASFSIAKFALGHGVPASGYAFWQAAGSALVILAVCLVRRARLWLTPTAIGFYMMTGLVCLALPNVVMFVVLRQIPAGIMAVTVALMPLLTYGLTLLAGIESLDRRRLGGIGAGLAGVLLILLPRSGLPAPEMAPWVVLAILTPALFSLGSVYVSKRRPPSVDVLALTFGMLFMAALGLLAFTLASGDFYRPRAALGPVEIAILLQVAVSSLGYILFFEIIRLAGPVFFSQIGYLVTISGLSFGMVVHGEVYSAWVWTAVGLIFLGLALVQPRQGSTPAR